MDKILELLNSITENTTIEEARRIVLDVVEMCKNIVDDINGYMGVIDELTKSNEDKDYEIARLKEENGRIYRDRAEQIRKNIDAEVDAVNEDDTATIEEELIANIDI